MIHNRIRAGDPVGAASQGSKFVFGFGSTCATRCKFLGAAKILGAELKILGAQIITTQVTSYSILTFQLLVVCPTMICLTLVRWPTTITGGCGYSFCREVFLFAGRLILFAVRFFVLPEFFFFLP